MKNDKNLSIFDKYVKKDYKLMPFKIKEFEVGEVKYYPPISKEWKNSIYTFNTNKMKNLSVYDNNINYIIKGYFDLYLNHKILFKKFQPSKNKRLSMNKIYLSKAEIKHTNSKAIITIYSYNRERISLLNRINSIKKNYYGKIYKIVMLLIKIQTFYAPYSKFFIKWIKPTIKKELALLRRYKLKLNINKYKFEEKLLYLLTSYISRYYNKKVVFNIVNMKSIILNSDLFTNILKLKLKKQKINVGKLMKIILNKAKLPKVNRIIEKGSLIKNINFNLLDNKYKNVNLNTILNEKKDNLDQLLNETYYNAILDEDNNKINEIVFNSIKYKNMGGIRLEVKGRLTKRYRADRSLFKLRWKGGLKNIDSSYKGLSTINKRGYLKPNVEYSIFTAKRRIGAFAVKGWISGK